MGTGRLEQRRVVSRDEWLAARQQLLTQEKQFTREYDRICALRHELPWVRVETDYVFDTPKGKETLGDQHLPLTYKTTELALTRVSRKQMSEGSKAAYDNKEPPLPEHGSMCYMMSSNNTLVTKSETLATLI